MQAIDYQGRIRCLSQSLAEAKLDVYVGTRMASLHYLVGAFIPWRGAVIVTSSGQARLLYWANDSERIRKEGWGMEVIEFGGEAGFIQALAADLQKSGLASGRIGLDLFLTNTRQEAPGLLLAHEYLELKNLLSKAELVNGTSCIDELMLIKSPAEIERIRLAGQAADAGFYAGLAAIRTGTSENVVAGAIENAMRMQGSIWAWSVTGGTEVGSGPRTAFFKGVTQQSTEKKIGEDEFVILDIHPMVELYIVDLALTAFLGKPNGEQQKMMDCWQDTVDTLWSSLKPGNIAGELCQKAFKVFANHGFQDFGLPMFGHGLGTDARTRPFMNPKSQEVLKAGMVISIGTHLYKPGVGGARQEYPLLITETGAESLSRHPAKIYPL